MLQEGPVAAVLVAVAAQLQLASTSCTPNQHHCTALAPFRPVRLLEVAAACHACLEQLSLRFVSVHTLQFNERQHIKACGQASVQLRARPCFCRLSGVPTTFSLSQKEEWWTQRRSCSRA